MTPAASRPLRRLQETDSVGYAGDPTRKEARPKFISREQFWFFHPFRVRYSEIEIVWVYTSQQTHRPVPITTSIRELIGTRELHLA